MLAAKRAFPYTSNGDARMLLYGTEEEQQRLYISTPVDGNMNNYCKVFYPKTVPLYFTSMNVLFAGDSTDPIVTVCPYHDSALIFNQNSVRLFHCDEEGFQANVVLTGIGCIPRNGAQICGTSLITVSKNGVYRLCAKSGDREALITERISAQVQSRLKDYNREDTVIFWNDFHRELWLCTPQEDMGTVWVWNETLNVWYRFDDMMTTGFFNSRLHGVCMCNGNVVYRITPNLYSDNGNSYIASYQSKYLDLGDPDTVHRSLRWSLTCEAMNAEKNMTLYTTRGAIQHHLMRPFNNQEPEHYEGRIATHRHRFFRFQFTANGGQSVTLYRVAFYAKP
jgi:hypothetical protein